jgi:hypothetical protein
MTVFTSDQQRKKYLFAILDYNKNALILLISFLVKIMTSQIVTNDELTNLIQERLANRRTGERTEFANQLARKLIKK